MDSNSQESVDKKCDKLLQLIETSHELPFESMSNLLSELKILTREKSFPLPTLNKCICLLVPASNNGHVEAQKCLSNLIMNYEFVRKKLVEPYVTCTKTRLDAVLGKDSNKKINIFLSNEHKQELLYYDLRLVFLLSAMNPESRHFISNNLSHSITELLYTESSHLQRNHDYQLINECLKVLFNLTLESKIDHKLIGSIIRKLFDLLDTAEPITDPEIDMLNEKYKSKNQMFVNIIHLLTNMPEEDYDELTNEHKDKILNHLRSQLNDSSKESFRDNVLPVLKVCSSICRYSFDTRKRWFQEILHSSEGFERRPEEYEDFRGKLVKLMTSVDVHIKDMAADFLHSLCDGDTEKFITYTGLGNSAAYLSSRGLLNNGSTRTKGTADDPQYQDLRDRLNPITGKIETVKRNPMEGMTEEEKEYHAEELANAITKLSSLGVMKPICINKDETVSDTLPK